MDSLTFISNTIGALAWPTAFLVFVIIFRRPLRDLINRINEVTGPGGLRLGLGRSLERGQKTSEEVALERADSSSDVIPPTLSASELQFAKDFPGAAFDKFYKEAESRLLQLRAQIPDHKPHRNLNEVMKWLKDHGHVSESAGRLWLDIRDIRNQAFHVGNNDGITSYDAVTFGTQVKQLLEALRNVKFAR